MTYRILATDEYEKNLDTLNDVEQIRIERFVAQIAENAVYVGKPLRYRFLREKKFNGKRLYFLVYAEWNAALLARISNKKQQPETIDWILSHLPELRQYVETKLRIENLI